MAGVDRSMCHSLFFAELLTPHNDTKRGFYVLQCTLLKTVLLWPWNSPTQHMQKQAKEEAGDQSRTKNM